MGVEDTLAFRLNQFNLGAPLQWHREVYNMTDVAHEKLQRLNRISDEWNGNQIPFSLFQSIYEIAAYSPRSRNQRDMDDQNILYIHVFELCNSYDTGKFDSVI